MSEQFQTDRNMLAPGKTCSDGSDSTSSAAAYFCTHVQRGMLKSSAVQLPKNLCIAAIGVGDGGSPSAGRSSGRMREHGRYRNGLFRNRLPNIHVKET